jgi:glycine betaine/proline transport system permease protein
LTSIVKQGDVLLGIKRGDILGAGKFPVLLRFEVGIYVDMLVSWLIDNFAGFFDGITGFGIWFLIRVETFLSWLPWWFVLLFILIITWKAKKNIKLSLFFTFLVFFIGAFGLWVHMIQTLAIVLTSVAVSLILGIPSGIIMAYSNKLNNLIRPVLDFMQTMPGLVYLIPAVILFGMGRVPAVFATTIYAVPPVIRLTDLGIRRVSREMVEASFSFGASAWQTLVKVQFPQALPTIMTGVNQTTMMALAMVVFSSMIGARGLGMEVLIAINQMDIARGFEAGISIVFLAIIIDRISQGVADRFRYPE